MKVFKLKKWLCGIVMMFALVFITNQVSFAKNENTTDEQNLESSNQGEVGIVRYRLASKLKAQGLRELDKTANSSIPSGSVQLYAAFTSDKASDPSDENDPVTIVPVLDDTGAYLYVAFRVTAPMTVDIRWTLDGTSTPYEVTDFRDPVTNGNLTKDFWYFAWYKPSSITPNGVHTSDLFVKKNGQVWGASKTDSCKFTVLANLVP